MIRRRSLTLAALALFALSARAAESEKKVVILDPAQGGIDYKLQGEYVSGGSESAKWGAQVIALGDGKFHAVFEPGGLPGDGWDAKTRYESEGSLDEGKVTLHGVDKVAWGNGHHPPPGVEVKHGFDATIEGETLTAKVEGGETVTFKHTERHSPAEGAKPPQGATVLFDGSSADAFKGGKIIADGPWKGFLKEGCETKQKVTDFQLHVEFIEPFKPFARFQERGNSGIYIQKRYETQVLDSFGLLGYDNECGGAYTQHPPLVNMCYPPLTWQTYDIEFKAARYADGKRTSPATVTVKHNGVLVQDHYELTGPTGAGQKENPKDAIQTGVIYLQEHNNPVAYRNIWIVEEK
jgi:hypothetical protein